MRGTKHIPTFITSLLLLSFFVVVESSPTDLVLQSFGDNVPPKDVPNTKSGEEDDWTMTGWRDPRLGGGRMLDFTTPDLGEPINVIISGRSDPSVLSPAGIRKYARSLGFNEECLGMHLGDRHSADLGDGDGKKIEHFLSRQHYFPIWGSCWESLRGGNHFRAWRQNGTDSDTGAWFLACSKEKYVGDHHLIEDDGYNLGRDFLVERAVAGSRWRNMWYKADVEWNDSLLDAGSEGVNHDIPQDGKVAILTVRRL